MNNKTITINNKTSFLDGRNTENGWYEINLLTGRGYSTLSTFFFKRNNIYKPFKMCFNPKSPSFLDNP